MATITAPTAPDRKRVPPNPIRRQWDRLSRLPAGRWIFSRLLRLMVPYTGTIKPTVLELRTGYARVEMRDRRGVRNHLRSIHAVALLNIAEAASGLALVYSMPDGMRGILVGMSIEYMKKARGTLVAECHCEVPAPGPRRELELTVEVRDAAGDVVARARPRWLVESAA